MKMTRTKLQRILNRLDGKSEETMKVISDFDASVKEMRDKLERNIVPVATITEVNTKLANLRKYLNTNEIVKNLEDLKTNFKSHALQTLNEIEAQSKDLKDTIDSKTQALDQRIDLFSQESESTKKDLSAGMKLNSEKISLIEKGVATLSETIPSLAEKKKVEDSFSKLNQDSKDYVDKTRIELLNKIAEAGARPRGGGNMNRNILIGGNASTLSKYTDVNLKAGNNVTITYQNNETLKTLDVTIDSTGGGGGGSVTGIIRSINNISTSQTAGGTAGTDYVYLCTAGVRLTLPTAIGNENLYTIKNVSNSSVLVATTGGQTIDDDTTIIMPVKYTSVDLISDSANWGIT